MVVKSALPLAEPQNEAALHELGTADLEPPRGQREAALERAVRNLELAQAIARAVERQRPRAADDERRAVELDVDALGRDPRHGDDDDDLALVLEDVDRRLPRRRGLDGGEAEELTMQPLGL